MNERGPWGWTRWEAVALSVWAVSCIVGFVVG